MLTTPTIYIMSLIHRYFITVDISAHKSRNSLNKHYKQHIPQKAALLIRVNTTNHNVSFVKEGITPIYNKQPEYAK